MSATFEAPALSAKPEKLAAQIARQLEDQIIAQRWPVGEVLGSESALQDRFGVSRSVLREAIRLLEHHEIARMRRGPRGGLVVCAPDATPAISALVIYLEYVGVSATDLVRARLLLEPMAARIVAETISEDGIAELRRCAGLDRVTVGDPTGSVDDTFHVTLVRLSGNPVLQLFTEFTNGLAKRYARDVPNEVPARPSTTAHAEIIDTIVAGDAAVAQTRLTAHLEEVYAQSLAGRVEQRSARMRTRPSDPDTHYGPGRKLAEITAGRLHDDITSEGWQIGEVLGSESALVARYGVSRSVLREAVRILEHHSVAEMRRGPGGGLVILAPDPKASIHTIALYLDYLGMKVEHLKRVREAIEIGCVQTVSTAGLTPGATTRLRRTLDQATPANGRGNAFHTEIGGLADNPVLTIFLRILADLWGRHSLPAEPPTSAAQSDTREAHEKILDALAAGDAGLARHRMHRHLQELTIC